MLRRLFDWTMSFAVHRHAMWALFILAFVESSVFPIPPDILIIPMILAAREKAWKIAGVATIGSVLGGIAGYGIGFFLYDSIGQPILELYGKADKFAEFQALYNEFGAWVVGMGGLTPFPYKVITIASGVTGLDMVTFVVVSILARGARFFLEAVLLWHFGSPIRSFVEKYLGLIAGLSFIVFIGGFAAVKFLF